MSESEIFFLQGSGQPDLAWCGTFPENANTSIVWLGGLASNMQGRKTSYLHPRMAAQGHNYIAFDYSGHGQSDKEFAQCSISDWREDTLRIIDTVTNGPLILVGSSLGGWMALLAALARPDRVAGLVLLAPAVDFTERLVWQRLTAEERDVAKRDGWVKLPSDPDYSSTQLIYDQIVDGRKWLLMDSPIRIKVPVRILQGGQDTQVPSAHSLLLSELIEGDDVVLTLIQNSNHGLSRPEDLARIEDAVLELADSIMATSPARKSG